MFGSDFDNRYEIISSLGQGSFSHVYKARQHATGQEVAVKVLQLQHAPLLPDFEKQIKRFRQEIHLCASLFHPNIVRLIDSGERAGGELYAVFEFVPGRNLAEVLREEGKLEVREAVHLMKQLLDALYCAHDRGVVHRDLKPDNIMIVDTGVQRNAMILDFGIGSISNTGPLASARTRITADLEALGAPAYASPEQLRGKTDDITPRSDLYSWGLVFLECLSGTRIMDGVSLFDVLSKQLSMDPVPIPESLAVTDLGRLLQRATSKEVNERDVSAYELFTALEKLSAGHESLASVHAGIDRSAGLPASSPVTWERRQLTVLCCEFNITAAASKADELDIEEADRLLRTQHAVCFAAAETFEGYFASGLGQRVLLYFGYPKARQNDAQRAAQAACYIIQETRQLNEQLRTEQQVDIHARIGLHTGLMMVHHNQSALGYSDVDNIGTTPDMAMQISSLAEPDKILVSADARLLLRRYFAFNFADYHLIPGLSRPVEVFQLIEKTLDQEAEAISDTPMVGRNQEMALLLERWSKAVAGEGRAVLVSGAAGIGKSRLLREFNKKLVEQNHSWQECRCSYENQHKALHPFIDLLERRLRQLNGITEQSLETILRRYQFDDEEIAQMVPLFSELLTIPVSENYAVPQVSAERKKQLMYQRLLDLLAAVAEEQPTVLLVEDLHWADPSTVELLGRLLDDVATVPLLVVFTARPEFTPNWTAAQVAQLPLSSLTPDQVMAMMMGISGGKPFPDEVVDEVVQRTNGVCLFVEELTTSLLATGLLKEQADRYILEGALELLKIPATLRDLLTEKLDSLGRAKETAQLAAALGVEFSYELLAAVSPLDKLSLDKDLSALTKADLIHLRRSRRNPAYLFKHALIRDIAYELLSRARRQKTHHDIALMLENSFPQLKETRPDLLAYHYAGAGLQQQALDFGLQAGKLALQRSANHECINHVQQALTWLNGVENEQKRAERELALNSLMMPALFAVEGYIGPKLEATTTRSMQLIEMVGNTPETLSTLWMLRLYYHMRSERQQAREVAQRYIDLAESTGANDAIVAALPTLSQCLWQEGRLLEAKALCERAISLYDPERHQEHISKYGIDSLAFSQMTLGRILWFLGYPDQAIQYSQASLDYGKKLGHASTIGIAYLYVLFTYQNCGQREQALELGREAIKFCDDHGLIFPKQLCEIVYCWAIGNAETAKKILNLHRKRGSRLAHTYYRALIAFIEAEQGNLDEALRLIDTSIQEGETLGEVLALPMLYYNRGKLLLQKTKDVQAAERDFEHSITIAKEQHAFMYQLFATTSLCQLWSSQGQIEPARQLLSETYPLLTEGFTVPEVLKSRELYKQLCY